MINFSFLFLRSYIFFKRKIFGKIINYTEELSIECDSCKREFIYTIFYWRHSENQSKCSLCKSESKDDDYCFCNDCMAEKIEVPHLHLTCDFCEKSFGIVIENGETDISPCSRCGNDVVTSCATQFVCNSCRLAIC